MTRTQPISIQPRVNSGCAAAALGLFGAVFLCFGLIGILTMGSSVGWQSVLFTLPFTLFGLVLLLIALLVFRKGRVQAGAQSAMMRGGGQPAMSVGSGVGVAAGTAGTFGTAGGGRFGGQTMAESGPLVLRAGAARVGRLAGMLFVCLFWNGIVGLFTYFAYFGGINQGIIVRLFLIPFQIIGLLLLWGVVYYTLALLNPRPRLTLANRHTRLGESLTVQWEVTGAASRLAALRIELIGKEEATFRRGTDTKKDSHVFHRAIVAEARDVSRIERGMAAITIPAGVMPSFAADNNKIIWALQVSGDLGWWPDLDETFEITVTP